MVYSLNLLQIHQLTPRQWQSGHRKRRRERLVCRGERGIGGKGARGGHFIKRRPSCGQINAFPLRTNKFPRDADDASTTTNVSRKQNSSRSHSFFFIIITIFFFFLLLLNSSWCPYSCCISGYLPRSARLGAKHGQQQS